YGLRGAVEEVMLHHPDSVTALLDGRHEPSATPATTVHGVEIHSGDILVSRGGYPTSALIARGNDYPGNYSHIALVHADCLSHVASAIEAHIERGVAVSTADEYLGDKKLRIMVLRQIGPQPQDRKSTRLNSSHVSISYAVFCLKKKKNNTSTPASHTTTTVAEHKPDVDAHP